MTTAKTIAIGFAVFAGLTPLAYCAKEETASRYAYRETCESGTRNAGLEVGFWDCRF